MKTNISEIMNQMEDSCEDILCNNGKAESEVTTDDIRRTVMAEIAPEDLRPRRRRPFKLATMLCALAILIVAAVPVSAGIRSLLYTEGADYISEEYEDMIGKAIIEEDISEEVDEDEKFIWPYTWEEEGSIIKESGESIHSDMLPEPYTVFPVTEASAGWTTPEIISRNGAVCVFALDEEAGWELQQGEVISYSFEKYESEESGRIGIGYIKDGVLNDTELFEGLTGTYEVTADEAGTYYIYIVNYGGYQSMKEGTIAVK